MIEPTLPQQKEAFHVAYAGFWLRLVAYILDNIIVGFVLGIIFLMLMTTMNMHIFKEVEDTTKPEFTTEFYRFMFFGFILSWIYYAALESSKYQATVGKMTISLIVTDINGNRLSFAQASARFFAKIISNLTFYMGYLFAAFTKKKQALHDLIAGTLVVRNE